MEEKKRNKPSQMKWMQKEASTMTQPYPPSRGSGKSVEEELSDSDSSATHKDEEKKSIKSHFFS